MTELTKLYLAIACNMIVLLVTAYIVAGYFLLPRGEDKLEAPIGKKALRYYTTLSNIFSAVACGIALIFEFQNLCLCGVVFPHWVTLLKFYSAAAVTLTFVTVMLYLGPTIGYGKLLSRTSFHMHLAGPVLSVFSICVLEDFDRISVEETLVGMIPLIVYAWVYLRQVIMVSERDEEGNLIKGWEDFYGFNRGGKWYVFGIVMFVGYALILFGLRAIYIHI